MSKLSQFFSGGGLVLSNTIISSESSEFTIKKEGAIVVTLVGGGQGGGSSTGGGSTYIAEKGGDSKIFHNNNLLFTCQGGGVGRESMNIRGVRGKVLPPDDREFFPDTAVYPQNRLVYITGEYFVEDGRAGAIDGNWGNGGNSSGSSSMRRIIGFTNSGNGGAVLLRRAIPVKGGDIIRFEVGSGSESRAVTTGGKTYRGGDGEDGGFALEIWEVGND